MKIAMKNANIKPENVDYIQAHGSSTQLNEKQKHLLLKSIWRICI